MNKYKYKCNHAVGFCRDGWLYYEDFVFYMNCRLYYQYNRFNAFDYCPICGKNLKHINKKILSIGNEYQNMLYKRFLFRLEYGDSNE